MLWHVVVEAIGALDDIVKYETVVLAHTERSAKVLAARAINRSGRHDAHSIEADRLDIRETGVVFATVRVGPMPVITRKEAAVGQW